MSETINLLLTNANKKNITREERDVQRVTVAAFGFLIVVGIISIILLILTLQSPLAEIKKEQTSLSGKIASSQESAATLFFLQDRVKNISQIINKRQDIIEKLDSVIKEATNDISITGVKIDDKSLLVDFSSDSLASLDNFIKKAVIASIDKNQYKKFTLGDIKLAQQADGYTVSITVDL